jgi:hypothetical protein
MDSDPEKKHFSLGPETLFFATPIHRKLQKAVKFARCSTKKPLKFSVLMKKLPFALENRSTGSPERLK